MLHTVLHTGTLPAPINTRFFGRRPFILVLLLCISCGSQPFREFESQQTVIEDPVDAYLEALSLEQKIGQRFITYLEGTTIDEKSIEVIKRGRVGGFILYPWNCESVQQVRELTSDLQNRAFENDPPLGLFICVDQEGGRVATFRFDETTRFPPAYYWAGYNDARFVESVAYIAGTEIRAMGCNMDFAPVLDLYGRADSTIIGDRSMSNDPELVSRLGIAYLEGMKNTGVIPVIKHFPGHGSTDVDSHGSLPVVNREEESLLSHDFKPFEEAIHHGVDALMTAHVLFPAIDPQYPATLSEKILKGILRDRFGFRGLVISDGIAMGAVSNNFDLDQTLELLFRASVDLSLVHARYDVFELIHSVMRLYRDGLVTEEEINDGVKRILRLKTKLRRLSGTDYGSFPSQQ